MEFFTDNNGRNIMVVMGVDDAGPLAIQLAANIIWQCGNHPIEDDPQIGQPELTADAIRQSPHGSTQNLDSQVELLYGLVESVVSRPDVFWSSLFAFDARKVVQLVIGALAAYQQLKTAICRRGEEVHGAGWGSGRAFYLRDWTDISAKFNALLDIAPVGCED